MLLELRIQLNCSTVAKYDTVVLGAGQHNAIRIPNEKDHMKQWHMSDWSALTAELARRLGPDACPGQRAPKVVWMGNPARIMRVAPAAQSQCECPHVLWALTEGTPCRGGRALELEDTAVRRDRVGPFREDRRGAGGHVLAEVRGRWDL